MSATDTSPPAAAAPTPVRTRAPVSPVQLVAVAVFLVFVLFALPSLTSTYWLQICTTVAVYSIVTLSLGLLMGRVGLVSLCQIALLALAGWIALRMGLLFDNLPFPIVVLLTGVVTGFIGTLIGLPALRLSGLYLALITLMAAAAITICLLNVNFPNGGGGFTAYSANLPATSALDRPAIATSDPSYFRYVTVVAALMFLLALLHVRGKPGRAWAAIRQSQPAALAAGVNITVYKLWAFALASFMTGVAGGLLAGTKGGLTILQFPTLDSVTLLATVLMGGIFTLWGAVVAGILAKLLPALFDSWGIQPDLLLILFGIGLLQVLLTAPGGIASQLPKDLAKLGGLIVGLFRGRSKPEATEAHESPPAAAAPSAPEASAAPAAVQKPDPGASEGVVK